MPFVYQFVADTRVSHRTLIDIKYLIGTTGELRTASDLAGRQVSEIDTVVTMISDTGLEFAVTAGWASPGRNLESVIASYW